MIKYPNGDREKIKQLNKMFEKMDTIYNTLSSETQEIILDYHNEDSTVPYCIRWGLNGTSELLDKDAHPYKCE